MKKVSHTCWRSKYFANIVSLKKCFALAAESCSDMASYQLYFSFVFKNCKKENDFSKKISRFTFSKSAPEEKVKFI